MKITLTGPIIASAFLRVPVAIAVKPGRPKDGESWPQTAGNNLHHRASTSCLLPVFQPFSKYLKRTR